MSPGMMRRNQSGRYMVRRLRRNSRCYSAHRYEAIRTRYSFHSRTKHFLDCVYCVQVHSQQPLLNTTNSHHESASPWSHRQPWFSPRSSFTNPRPHRHDIRPINTETQVSSPVRCLLADHSGPRRCDRLNIHPVCDSIKFLRCRCQRCWSCGHGAMGQERSAQDLPGRLGRRESCRQGERCPAENLVYGWTLGAMLPWNREDVIRLVCASPCNYGI